MTKKLNKLIIHGFTLVDLMVSMAIGVTLLLGLSTMYQLSGQTSLQISISSDIYSSGLQAINYLRSNIQYAGANFVFPYQMTNQALASGGAGVGAGSGTCGLAGYGTPAPAGVTNWVIPGWTYLGLFADNNPRMFAAETDFTSTSLQPCIDWINTNYPASQYMEIQYNYQCGAADPNADKTNFYNDPKYGLNRYGTQATLCADTLPHNCGGCWQNDVYQKLIPHVVVTPNPNYAAGGDSISITFAVRAGGMTDCLGNVVAGPGASSGSSTVPVLVNDVFQVSANNTLQCQTRTQTNGTWTAMSAWTDIIPNIEHMRVMVGLNDNVGWDGTGNHRYATPNNTPPTIPTFPTLYSPPAANPSSFIDVNRIVNVRIALVARSTQNVFSTNTATTLTLFNATSLQYTSAADLLQRKLFTTTIFLANFTPPPYPIHCVQATPGSGQFYVKSSGIPWINSATASDGCAAASPYGGPCSYYGSFNSCESSRNYQAFYRLWPPSVGVPK